MARIGTTNVGDGDRLLRLVLGALLAVVGVTGLADYLALEAWIAAIALVVGTILIATGLARRCLIYRVGGLDTTR
ncbi:MAG: YgaP-like transmembrane domain [Halobacteriales archaeon]